MLLKQTNFLGIFWQNLSGLPNSGLCRAKFFHSVQLPPNSSVGGAGVSLSPYVELSVILLRLSQRQDRL